MDVLYDFFYNMKTLLLTFFLEIIYGRRLQVFILSFLIKYKLTQVTGWIKVYEWLGEKFHQNFFFYFWCSSFCRQMMMMIMYMSIINQEACNFWDFFFLNIRNEMFKKSGNFSNFDISRVTQYSRWDDATLPCCKKWDLPLRSLVCTEVFRIPSRPPNTLESPICILLKSPKKSMSTLKNLSLSK